MPAPLFEGCPWDPTRKHAARTKRPLRQRASRARVDLPSGANGVARLQHLNVSAAKRQPARAQAEPRIGPARPRPLPQGWPRASPAKSKGSQSLSDPPGTLRLGVRVIGERCLAIEGG